MSEPRYDVKTWDGESQEFTPQAGLTCESQSIPWSGLLECYRQLRNMGYSCYRNPACHDDNDFAVLVERADPEFYEQIDAEMRLILDTPPRVAERADYASK